MKWTLLFAVLMIVLETGHAWNIGSKGRTLGPMIHSTYIITPKNASLKIDGRAFVGYLNNGVCQYANVYQIGYEFLQTGDVMDIDGFALKSLVGGGYTCMTIVYSNQQMVRETFQLFYDGLNYIRTRPEIAQVQIL
jgi:hypothetical protein